MFGFATTPSDERPGHQPRPARTTEPETEHYAEVVALPMRATDPAVIQTDRYLPVELHLLGGFRLLVNGELAHVGRMGERLLALLACRGRPASRSQVAHALWPDTTSERAHANLRNVLYRQYRRGPGTLNTTASYLQLCVHMQIDLEQSTQLARQILGNDGDDDRGLLTGALSANLYDDLLPDWDDEWLGDYQYRYRQLRLTALETLSSRLTAAGHHGAAVQAALTAVHADRLRDSAHEALIRACLAQGNWHEALTHYTTYRRILRDELGLEPPAAIGRLLSSA